MALYRLGAAETVRDWLPGLARTARQGPFAQGHFVGSPVENSYDAAPKAPPQRPYQMDWACSSSGAFVGLVLEGVFGLNVTLKGEVEANPRLEGIDPSARLHGLVVAGQKYDVSAAGVEAVRNA
jgi:hypothetical protein